MIKIIYFDDSSATDYLNIFDGGEKIQTSDKIVEKNKELAGKAIAKASARFSWFPFFGVEGEVSGKTGFSYDSNSLIKTTLANTVLTDFLDKIKDDRRITKFEGHKVYAYKESMAFYKMFSPYLIMTKSDKAINQDIMLDISKIDEALASGKGYYELIAERNAMEGKKYVFRFNLNAFRNNYGIADLTKMELTFYGIKVGKIKEEMLNIAEEFNTKNKQYNSAIDILGEDDNDLLLEVYDIIIAGIEAGIDE